MKPIYAALTAIFLAGCQATTALESRTEIPLANGDTLVCQAGAMYCSYRMGIAMKEPPSMLREQLARQGFRYE